MSTKSKPNTLTTQESIVALTSALVRIPAQGDIDAPKAMLQAVSAWLAERSINHRLLLGQTPKAAGKRKAKPDAVAVVIEITGAHPGPTYCFDACVDTAPAGNLASWTHPPFAAQIDEGWLYGRGAADSKVAVAILCHLAEEFQKRRHEMHGKLSILLDGDEHTGRFGGVKEYIAKVEKPAGLVICYPGNDRIAVGARGFYRVAIDVHGTAQHAGSSQPVKDSAATKALLIGSKLTNAKLAEFVDKTVDRAFTFGPKLTITAMHGGSGFAQVPDLITINVDVRLTPSFTAERAAALVRGIVDEVDAIRPDAKPCKITEEESWPPYQLADGDVLTSTFVAAASEAQGKPIGTFVCGPSNIGCYLASFGVPATCGYGVNFRNIHAADEAIEIASIPAVLDTYRKLAEKLLVPVAVEK